jgi:hypothetical protein
MKEPKTTKISVRVSDRLYNELKQEAEDGNSTLSKWIVKQLELRPQKEIKRPESEEKQGTIWPIILIIFGLFIYIFVMVKKIFK